MRKEIAAAFLASTISTGCNSPRTVNFLDCQDPSKDGAITRQDLGENGSVNLKSWGSNGKEIDIQLASKMDGFMEIRTPGNPENVNDDVLVKTNGVTFHLFSLKDGQHGTMAIVEAECIRN